MSYEVPYLLAKLVDILETSSLFKGASYSKVASIGIGNP